MARKKVDLEVIAPSESDKKSPKKESSSKSGGQGRPLWSGSISFGLVNVPVRMVPGTRRNELRFHLLHEKDNARLKRKYICTVDGKEVPEDEIKKGYEISPEHHVIMDESELKALAPKASRTIDLLYFIPVAEIDPIYFDTPYYLLPAANGEKAYALLVKAMRETGRAAISEIIMRGKEYLAAVRPSEDVLALDTMRFPNEIVFPKQLPWKAPTLKVSDRELKAAKDLVQSLDGKFEPSKLHDDYREMVLKAIERKAKGNKIAVSPQAEEAGEETEAGDLMAALQKSLERSNQKKSRVSA